MRKILPVIVFLSFGVISLFAQSKNPLPGFPGSVGFVSVSNLNKIELKTKFSDNSIFTLYGKYSVGFQQNINSSLNMMLDSVVTKDATENYLDKKVYYRDNNERDTLIAQYTWNSSTTEWDLSAKNNLTHDSRGNITSNTNVVVFGGFSLGTSKYVASYDVNNHQTERINYTWNFLTSSWLASTKNVSNYTNGKKTLDMDYTWVKATNSWKVDGKADYSYDANGYLTQEVDLKLNTSTSLLENNVKYVFLNDAAGRDTLSTEYRWASNTSTWDLYGKTVMTYAPNGAPSSILSYEWDSSTSLWVGLFKGVYSFDNNGNMASVVSYTWDDNLSAWIPATKTDFLYNANGNLTADTSYMWSGSAWTKQTVSNYFYSPSKFTGLSEINGGIEMTIYPNPAISFIKINNLLKPATVSIVSIDGRIIVLYKQFAENVIDVARLKAGIYYLLINTVEGKYTYKFVKR